MLRQLTIRNFGLASEVDIDFVRGANIITGETGSGKSILLEALALVLGERADNQQWDQNPGKTVIEVSFENIPPNVQDWLSANSLDNHEPLLVRREIQPAGRSRSFINDTPVNLAMIKSVGAMLINIHTQHQTSELFDAGYGYRMLDAFSGLQLQAGDYENLYRKYVSVKKEIENIEEQIKGSNARKDFIAFQLEELEKASLLDSQELTQLEEEFTLLENMSTIKSKLFLLSSGITEDQGLADTIRTLYAELKTVGKFAEPLRDLLDRLNALLLEVKDIAHTADHYSDDLVLDEERLNVVRDRIDLLNRLLRKHQLSGLSELIELRDKLQLESGSAEADTNRLEALKKDLTVLEADLKKQASVLHTGRVKAATSLETGLMKLLKEVGLNDAVIRAEIRERESFAAYPAAGSELQLLFAANKGYSPRLLKDVASGGELSRLMLCFKSLLAGKLDLGTLVFDEIDTGISGETALKVSKLLSRISATQQVICITHLPQTARIADAHVFISKSISSGGKTITTARNLTREQQEEQLAKMIAGEKYNPEALQTARQLIKTKNDFHE